MASFYVGKKWLNHMCAFECRYHGVCFNNRKSQAGGSLDSRKIMVKKILRKKDKRMKRATLILTLTVFLLTDKSLVLCQVMDTLQGMCPEPIEQYTLNIEKDPNSAGLYVCRGEKYLQLREFSKAFADFDKAMGLDDHVEKPRIYTVLMMWGQNLDKELAEELEHQIESAPGNIFVRILLVSYYQNEGIRSYEARMAQHRHRLWFIQERPDYDSRSIINPLLFLMPGLDDQFVDEVEGLWFKKIEESKNDPKIILNAAEMLLLIDNKFSIELYEKGRQLYPSNPIWAEGLGQIYELNSRDDSEDKKKYFSSKSFLEYKQAYEAAKGSPEENYILKCLVWAAYKAGEYAPAYSYAQELLERGATLLDEAEKADALHAGHTVLGLLAIKEDNIESAKDHLLKSGDVRQGSPVLDSFGPAMDLAKELSERGERETVLAYFELCSKFWESGKDELQKWRKVVEAGGIPDFGSNLN